MKSYILFSCSKSDNLTTLHILMWCINIGMYVNVKKYIWLISGFWLIYVELLVNLWLHRNERFTQCHQFVVVASVSIVESTPWA